MALHYWKLRLHLLKGAHVSTQTIHYHLTEADLPPENEETISQSDIVSYLKAGYSTLQDCQQNHCKQRIYLESLADSIVLHRNPNLQYDSVAHLREERRLKEIRQLLHREKMRKTYNKIGHILEPRNNSGITRVDIPDPKAAQHIG
jgi:hypothetical protein